MLSIKEFTKEWISIILLMVKDLVTRYDSDQLGFYFCYVLTPILAFVMLIMAPFIYLAVLIDDLGSNGWNFPNLIDSVLEYRFFTPKDKK